MTKVRDDLKGKVTKGFHGGHGTDVPVVGPIESGTGGTSYGAESDVISRFTEDEGENGTCLAQPFRRRCRPGRMGDLAVG